MVKESTRRERKTTNIWSFLEETGAMVRESAREKQPIFVSFLEETGAMVRESTRRERKTTFLDEL
jgi:hypothetical protein